jgi:hypothetical protein
MRQRSRVPWLREGDHNTKFFHAQAAQRRRMNKINKLERADGSVCQSWKEDQDEVQQFFRLFTRPRGLGQWMCC